MSGAQINISRGSSNARTPERIVTIKVNVCVWARVCVVCVHVHVCDNHASTCMCTCAHVIVCMDDEYHIAL